jgi:hypothetical protein
MGRSLEIASEFLQLMDKEPLYQRVLSIAAQILAAQPVEHRYIHVDDFLRELVAKQICLSRRDIFQMLKRLEGMIGSNAISSNITLGRRGHQTRFYFYEGHALALIFAAGLQPLVRR